MESSSNNLERVVSTVPGTCRETLLWKLKRLEKPMEHSVQLLKGRYSPSPKKGSSYRILSVQVLPSLALAEELPVNCINKYEFHGCSTTQ